jgi:hypothetical protein
MPRNPAVENGFAGVRWHFLDGGDLLWERGGQAPRAMRSARRGDTLSVQDRMGAR